MGKLLQGLAVLSVAILLVCGCSPVTPPHTVKPADPPPGDVRLRVMSFNLRLALMNDGANSWKLRCGIVVDMLKELHPDIIGTQEGMQGQINFILKSIPEYGFVGKGRNSESTGEFCAVFYDTKALKLEDAGTFWLSDTPEKPGSMSWDNMFPRVCTWARFVHIASGRRVDFYNTHLDHVGAKARAKGAELIAQRIAERAVKVPVIVTGDLNSTVGDPAWSRLTGRNEAAGTRCELADAFAKADPDGIAGTYHGFAGSTQGRRIDHIFCSRDFAVVEAQVVRYNRNGKYPSDHFPVMADIMFSIEPAGPGSR